MKLSGLAIAGHKRKLACDTGSAVCVYVCVGRTAYRGAGGGGSLVPRPHPLRGKRGLVMVNLDRFFFCLAGSVRARRHRCTETLNLGSDWSVMLLGRGPTIQIYIAGMAMALCRSADQRRLRMRHDTSRV